MRKTGHLSGFFVRINVKNHCCPVKFLVLSLKDYYRLVTVKPTSPNTNYL